MPVVAASRNRLQEKALAGTGDEGEMADAWQTVYPGKSLT